MPWCQPGCDVVIGGRMPALVQGMLPEWMSPTCSTRLTALSALTELISSDALLSRFWLYGQSPNTAIVSGLAPSRSLAIAGLAASAAASSAAETRVLVIAFSSFHVQGGANATR